MAILHVQDEAGCWSIVPLEQDAYVLDGGPTPSIRRRAALPANGGALLLRTRNGDADTWLLKAAHSGAVAVNSQPLYLGLRVLRDRDEIRMDGAPRFYFSTEQLARVAPLPEIKHAVFCTRCNREIRPGDPSVQCPQCGTWCHQMAELNCWTYGQNCPLCDQPTALEAGHRWTPEAL